MGHKRDRNKNIPADVVEAGIHHDYNARVNHRNRWKRGFFNRKDERSYAKKFAKGQIDIRTRVVNP